MCDAFHWLVISSEQGGQDEDNKEDCCMNTIYPGREISADFNDVAHSHWLRGVCKVEVRELLNRWATRVLSFDKGGGKMRDG